MRQGMALYLGNKMKYLTAPYLALMQAFSDHALERLDDPDLQYLNKISLMQEYGTLRLDGGRQTGKTEAVARFAADWLAEGKSVIVIANTYSYAKETCDRIKRRHSALENIDVQNGVLIADSVRSFLDSRHDKFRGVSLKRTLIIIEEPIRVPEMFKFYASWKDLAPCYVSSSETKLPLFFVMGMQ